MTDGMDLPEAARCVLSLLEDAGHSCYVVGACVRDWLLHRSPSDIELVTDVGPEELHRVLEPVGAKVFDVGVSQEAVAVVVAGSPIAVVVGHGACSSVDGRTSEGTQSAFSLEDDLVRRDFTMNAMAYHPEQGLIDPFGGQEDLRRRRIRCVGIPGERFEEDPLLVMRAIRLASQLSCTLDVDTFAAAKEKAGLLGDIPVREVAREFLGFVCGVDIERALNSYIGIVGAVIPELLPMEGFDQHNGFHPHSVLGHTALAMRCAPALPVLRMTMLLHDCGKPETFEMDERGRGHCPGHPEASARIAGKVLERLGFPPGFRHRVVTLIENHHAGFLATRENTRMWLGKLGPDTLRELLRVKRADISALAAPAHEWLPLFDDVEYLMDELIAEGAC